MRLGRLQTLLRLPNFVFWWFLGMGKKRNGERMSWEPFGGDEIVLGLFWVGFARFL